MLNEAAQKLGDSATAPSDLADSLAGDSDAKYQSLVEEEWRQFILVN